MNRLIYFFTVVLAGLILSSCCGCTAQLCTEEQVLIVLAPDLVGEDGLDSEEISDIILYQTNAEFEFLDSAELVFLPFVDGSDLMTFI